MDAMVAGYRGVYNQVIGQVPGQVMAKS